jgi:hypothetical protein
VGAAGVRMPPDECAALLESREPFAGLAPHAALPDDTRLWAALQRASGGTWGGCVYDVDRIEALLDAGARALANDGTAAAAPAGVNRLTGAAS